MAYEVKVIIDEKTIRGKYEIKELLEKIEEVIEWQQKEK